jgi:hypothetical protein
MRVVYGRFGMANPINENSFSGIFSCAIVAGEIGGLP